MTKLLVYRFSAMGDVILLLPVLKGVLDANKDVEIYLLTQPGFFPFFKNIDRLHLVGADLKAKNKGILGLFSLFNQIRKEICPNKVIDAHCVLRTYILDFLFRISGYRVVSINKGTWSKKRIIKSKNISFLPTTVDRYSDTFFRADYDVKLPLPSLYPQVSVPDNFSQIFNKPILIGIAPFAKHQQKIWGIEKVENLIERLNQLYDLNVLLFGGGKAESEILNRVAQKYDNCIVSSNYFNLDDEIRIIPRLAVMVSMDSANMHLASMGGIPTVSVWGATHPALGFAPYMQPKENLIQYAGDELPCRPCSVYGNKKCIYSDEIRCMQFVSVEMVLNRITQILSGE